MTEKQYKLERWTDTSLYYSFPTGSVHQGIGYVIEKVEKDLNQLAEENEQLRKQNELLIESLKDTAKPTTKPMMEVRWDKGVYE